MKEETKKFEGMTTYEIFKWVQQNIKVKKTKFNAFSKFFYRSVEDIYTAWNALEVPLTLKISDEIIERGSRIFVEATAEIKDLKGNSIETAKAQAELGIGKAGMSSEQATGSASSYARKYSLNGLFLLDDNVDPDDPAVSKTKSKSANTGEKINEDQKSKLKELQNMIRGNVELAKKANILLAGRSVLKLTAEEINHIIKELK